MKGNCLLFSNFSCGVVSNYSDSCSSSPLGGNSQPYQNEYSVYDKMIIKDIQRGVYDPQLGYTKNPTAQYLDSMINGNYIGNKYFNKQIPYVITTDGRVIVGSRNGNGKTQSKMPTPHPTLIGGINPKVKMAGILDIRGGKIYSYNNQSGHYRPHPKSIECANDVFKNFPKHRDFKGGIIQ